MGQQTGDARVDPRVDVRVPVVVFGAAPDRQEIEMVTRNLSAGGTLCESAVSVPLGTPVSLRLDLADEAGVVHPVVSGAIAVRVEGAGPFTVAFHFVNAPARVVDRVKRFVFRALRSSS